MIIKCLLLDVDGILTDGKLWYDANGEVLKCFHVHDGQGIKDLIRNGIIVGVISGRDCNALRKRLSDLGITRFYLGVDDKLHYYNQIKQNNQLIDSDIAYMGDDTPDIPVMKQVGLPITVPNAIESVKAIARYITVHSGGQGAVREICDYLLAEQRMVAN